MFLSNREPWGRVRVVELQNRNQTTKLKVRLWEEGVEITEVVELQIEVAVVATGDGPRCGGASLGFIPDGLQSCFHDGTGSIVRKD